MAETIIVHGSASGVDDDGYPIPGEKDREIAVKNVQPLALEELAGMDLDGVKDVLRVWAYSGADVKEGDDVTIRGLRYVVGKTAWDWSRNRRPALRRHNPGVVFDCVRGAG